MTDVSSITALSMLNDMKQMEMVSHNLANVNTVGYKRDIPRADMFSMEMSAIVERAMQQLPTVAGTLVPELKSVTDHSQGMMKFSDNPLNVAIEGEGYFELSTPNGVLYTRGGEFRLDSKSELVSSDGYALSGIDGNIRLLSNTPRIDGQGKVWEENDLLGQLKVVQFDEQAVIEKVGAGLYSVSGVAKTVPESTRVRQGFIEAGNVNVTDEMVRMMATVRHFEMSQRLISSYDAMIGEAISTIAEF